MAQAKSNRAPAQINRRRLLSAIPAVAVLPAMAAVPASAKTETPMSALFREWEHIRSLKKAPMSEDEYDALLDRQIALEDEMIITRAQNASDWAMKIMAYSCLGESGLPDHHDNPALWAEARALIAA